MVSRAAGATTRRCSAKVRGDLSLPESQHILPAYTPKASDNANSQPPVDDKVGGDLAKTPNAGEAGADAEEPKRTKTILEQDEELRLKLEGISGEGGGAGVEYEGGKAVGLKRGVRENMFRVI